MQTNENTQTVETNVQPVPSIEAVSAITSASEANLAKLKTALASKRTAKQPATTNGKAAAKRVHAKPASITSKPAKPDQASRDAAREQSLTDRRLARDVAARAVDAFYSGASKPFKAASDRFADINSNNGKSATPRQAGLMLALITYGAGNMRSDGTFIRGAFRVPAKLVNASAKPGETVLAQPESGCLGNMLGRTVDFKSGPVSGIGQATATYKLRVDAAIAEIQATFGDTQAKAARKLLAGFDSKAA